MGARSKKNGFLFLAKFPSCSAEELDHAYMQVPAPTVSTGQSRLLCLVSTANCFPKWKQTQIFRFPWEVRWHVSNLNRCLRLVSSGLLSWALGRNWGIWAFTPGQECAFEVTLPLAPTYCTLANIAEQPSRAPTRFLPGVTNPRYVLQENR